MGRKAYQYNCCAVSVGNLCWWCNFMDDGHFMINLIIIGTTALYSKHDYLRNMPHKDPDAKRAYDREWRRRQRAKKKAERQN